MHTRIVHHSHMKLSDFLARSGTTLEAFGTAIGVSHSTVQRWATGQSRPRGHKAMEAVAKATRGAVTAADFFDGPATLPGLAEAEAPFQAEARALGLDAESIAARAVQAAIQAEKERRWIEENRAAMEAQNAWIEEHGLPLARHRMF